ncbi:uncharacterized protein LOC134968708 [Pseudophryne corroboree]|uniref:uncharacterized protein LOC134968708 n=1 Tax=Pseudophryne corroboree TaxID=495146 RepID=UPI003081A865
MPHTLTLDNPSMVAEPSMLHHDATVDHASMLDQPSMLQHTSTVDDPSFVAEPSMLKHPATVDDPSMVDQPSMMQEYYSVVDSSTTEETSMVNEPSMRQDRSTEDENSTMQNPLMLDKAIESNMVPATQTQDNINEEPVLHSQQSNIDTEDTNQVELNAETAHSSVLGQGLQDQFLDSTNQDMSQTILGDRVKELKIEGYRVIHVSCLKRQIDNRNILSEILQVVHSFNCFKYIYFIRNRPGLHSMCQNELWNYNIQHAMKHFFDYSNAKTVACMLGGLLTQKLVSQRLPNHDLVHGFHRHLKYTSQQAWTKFL